MHHRDRLLGSLLMKSAGGPVPVFICPERAGQKAPFTEKKRSVIMRSCNKIKIQEMMIDGTII